MPVEPELLLATSRFRVVRHRRETPGGRVIVRESIQHLGAVTILPMLDDDRICLIRNYRVAVGATLIELPAGTLTPGEDPLACAHRELLEETGYRAASMRPLTQLLMSPGILNERMHVFVATGLTAGTAAPEAEEEIEPLIVPFADALDLIRSGAIADAKTVAALLYYDRFWCRLAR